MSSSTKEVAFDCIGFVTFYTDGTYKKAGGTETVPAGVDPVSGVVSKDVVINSATPVGARLYIPKPSTIPAGKKLPLLIFFHGGGFIIESAYSPTYHNFLNLVVAESNVVVVSVDYRTAPEHTLPACFEDDWEAIKWVAKHSDGKGPEQWLNEYADLKNVFFAGDSAGANTSHRMAIRLGSENPGGDLNLKGYILLNPYFYGKDPIGSESEEYYPLVENMWKVASPNSSAGLDDPMINPDKDPSVANIKCPKVLVYIAELDMFMNRGKHYKDVLVKNGWKGDLELHEDKGVGHVYFLNDPSHESAIAMRSRICSFINDIAKSNV